MIQNRTLLKVIDNTGAKIIECIRVLKGSQPSYAVLGDIIVGVIKKGDPRKLVKVHEKCRAVIVRQKKEYKRKDGTYIRFDDNACVLLDAKTKEPKGNRIFGPIAREVKEKGFEKVSSLASIIL